MSIEAIKAIQMVYANTTEHDWPDDIWDAICQAIEAEKQSTKCVTSVSEVEPLAWMTAHRFDQLLNGFNVMTTLTKQKAFTDDVAIYTHPYTRQPKQEPVAEVEEDGVMRFKPTNRHYKVGDKLYLHPPVPQGHEPKQEPLTDEQAIDAQRYRLLRRGQYWSVIDGVGDVLRTDELDAAIDAAIKLFHGIK
jgi:hypothetical protein